MPRIRTSGLSLLPPSARKPRAIAAIARKAIAHEKARLAGEINVVFLDRKAMLAMNRKFLRHGHDTDVIAFQYDAEAPGAPFGDIYISAYQAKRQAEELGHPILKEVLTLVAHGTLHLLGHDDSSPSAKARMFRVQDAILGRKDV
jgi:probable rRNA maturation factor